VNRLYFDGTVGLSGGYLTQTGCTAIEIPANFYNVSELTGTLTRLLQQAYKYLNQNVLGKDYLVDISVSTTGSSFTVLPSGTNGCYTEFLSPSNTFPDYSSNPTAYELTFLGTFGSGFVQDNPQY
jgi:hypothetical protein